MAGPLRRHNQDTSRGGKREDSATSTSTPSHWTRHWSKLEHNVPISHAELIQALFRAIHDPEAKGILEIGAGMGGDSIALAKAGAKVYALDYTELAVRSIRAAARSERVVVYVIRGDALNLPFADATFDVVFHQGLLEHFHSREQIILLGENWRVLKRGGIAIVDVPQKFSSYTLEKRKLIKRGDWFAGWETEFTPFGLKRLFRRTGFRVRGFYPRGYYGTMARLRTMLAHEPPQGRGRFVPRPLRRFFRQLWRWFDRIGLTLYMCWSLGAVAEKPDGPM